MEHLSFAVAHAITSRVRAEKNGHRGVVVWLTGFSASGKSTLAMKVERLLFTRGRQAYVLDGDNVRRGLSSDLGFSPEDRSENIRRIGEVAALFADAGIAVITAFISPYRADRDRARKAAGEQFCEVYVKAPLELCEQRDPKGLYKKARAGLIPDFTGVSAPYEPPEKPELIVDTAAQTEEESVQQLVSFIEDRIRVDRV
jgi:bifunctional enzyme CysN/CysC